MVSDHEHKLIRERCSQLPAAQGNYLETDFIQNLFLTVLDFQMHGVAVAKSVRHYQENRWNEVRTLDELKGVLSRFNDDRDGNTMAAEYLWGNKHWYRLSLLRGLVSYFESVGINRQERLVEWAESRFDRDFSGKVKGLGYAVYQWLVMRQGIETVKPDTHLHLFVEQTIGHQITDEQLVGLLEGVARDLGLRAYELDWRIWEHQRGRPGTELPRGWV
ncbi:MAG: hypothetical protein HYS09_04735 [Chloroflexi bacterium]|nr:hypothetical protein [Chloroflexota bacterium]